MPNKEYVHIELWRYNQFLNYKKVVEESSSPVFISLDTYSSYKLVYTRDETVKGLIDTNMELDRITNEQSDQIAILKRDLEEERSRFINYKKDELRKIPWYKRIFI